eukprot:gnl/MRDRNA2_/MRDRNA2_27129_c0_seq1.p1 gnl/MRDRNA2_/MRDRNA2_27129_c0~~gnl/MRDRNA2_/MRDRNA2_27129_c0_seq1.p1  ORF type:complete len:254 (+),score=22.77 gnl/MRDRNA2_/MRDRNA2_27129_c0_seq1:80-841(+)
MRHARSPGRHLGSSGKSPVQPTKAPGTWEQVFTCLFLVPLVGGVICLGNFYDRIRAPVRWVQTPRNVRPATIGSYGVARHCPEGVQPQADDGLPNARECFTPGMFCSNSAWVAYARTAAGAVSNRRPPLTPDEGCHYLPWLMVTFAEPAFNGMNISRCAYRFGIEELSFSDDPWTAQKKFPFLKTGSAAVWTLADAQYQDPEFCVISFEQPGLKFLQHQAMKEWRLWGSGLLCLCVATYGSICVFRKLATLDF